MPSLRCLISALKQAGGGDLLFGFASSVQSCCGEGGALQTDIAVCGEHSPCSDHTGLAPYRGVCAFPIYTAQAPGCSIWSGPCVECGSSFRVLHKSADLIAPAFCAFPGLSGSGSRRLGRPLPGCGAPFPSVAPERATGRVPVACVCSEELTSSHDPPGGGCRPSRISGSLKTDTRGQFAVWEGVASLGLSLPLFPPPCLPPPEGMGRLFSGVSQSLCFANGQQYVRAVNFSLLSHSLKKLPPTALRALWPVLTLSNAAHSSLFRPHLLVAGAGVWGTFLLEVAFRHVICGPYLIFPPS